MSEDVFVGADSFRRLLLGAAGGYELQGQDAQRWRYTAEEPPKEKDGDCCGRVLIAHAGAHCAVATSLQYAKENPEAVRVWMPLPKLPWEAEK